MPNSENDMPQSVHPTEFDLLNPERNRAWAVRLVELARKANKSVPVRHDRGKSGVFSAGDNEGYVFRLNATTGAINYLVRFTKKHTTILHHKYKVATQVMLWIDREDREYDYTLARNAFFQIMLAKTGIVMTDIQQTDKGKTFWLHRVNEVLDGNPVAGLYAYLWDRRTHNPTLTQITNDNWQLLRDAWGWAQSDQLSRLIISKTPLPTA